MLLFCFWVQPLISLHYCPPHHPHAFYIFFTALCFMDISQLSQTDKYVYIILRITRCCSLLRFFIGLAWNLGSSHWLDQKLGSGLLCCLVVRQFLVWRYRLLRLHRNSLGKVWGTENTLCLTSTVQYPALGRMLRHRNTFWAIYNSICSLQKETIVH